VAGPGDELAASAEGRSRLPPSHSGEDRPNGDGRKGGGSDRRLQIRIALITTIGTVLAAVVGAVIGLHPWSSSGPNNAAQIASCEHTHGLAGAELATPPRPGETQISKTEADATPGGTFTQTTYASCSWPPPPGADSDGYRAITVTLSDGPGQSDASGRDFMDVIESHCQRLKLTYVAEFQGAEQVLPPVVASAGDIWAARGTVGGLSRIAKIGSSAQQQLSLPYYPPIGSVVVLHSQQILQQATCLA
jgi:hypothetical protein